MLRQNVINSVSNAPSLFKADPNRSKKIQMDYIIIFLIIHQSNWNLKILKENNHEI